MDLEIMNLSEVSQKEKDKYHVIYHDEWNLKYNTTFLQNRLTDMEGF